MGPDLQSNSTLYSRSCDRAVAPNADVNRPMHLPYGLKDMGDRWFAFEPAKTHPKSIASSSRRTRRRQGASNHSLGPVNFSGFLVCADEVSKQTLPFEALDKASPGYPQQPLAPFTGRNRKMFTKSQSIGDVSLTVTLERTPEEPLLVPRCRPICFKKCTHIGARRTIFRLGRFICRTIPCSKPHSRSSTSSLVCSATGERPPVSILFMST